MSWLTTLSETYDNCKNAVASSKYEVKLMPVAHLTAEAHITISVDVKGNFLRAEPVEKDDATTIIPVTEDSATRGSGIAPHPLCDKLIYIAGDYSTYVKSDKKSDKLSEYHSEYMKLLKKWNDSEFATEKVRAINSYLSKGRVIEDLINARVFTLDDTGFLGGSKISGTKQSDCFIRFSVIKPEESYYTPETWKDKELFESFIAFNNTLNVNRNICYVTGHEDVISVKHPAKIRNTGDKAKIISSNNTKSFVYHGRFVEAEEAASVGYEVSQKAHNALRWLIGNQGYKNGSNTIVTWSVQGKELPEILDDSENIFGDLPEDENVPVSTGEQFAKKINQAIAGYNKNFDFNDKIAIMSVDTADGSLNGRLSIKYYTEFIPSIYFKNIENWYNKCSWEIIGDKKRKTGVVTPNPKEIAMAVYGTERNKGVDVDSKIQKACIERILPCITEGRKFPVDLVRGAVENVSRAMAFNNYNHYKLIGITCAIIKAHYKDKGKVVTMELDNCNDRSYLFGRLLAVADVLEQRTFDTSEKERETNAKRYWSVFVKKPAKTWALITDKLLPYMNKNGKYMSYYNRLFEEIHDKFNIEDYNDKELDAKYLLGYWCQRKAMNSKNENKKED